MADEPQPSQEPTPEQVAEMQAATAAAVANTAGAGGTEAETRQAAHEALTTSAAKAKVDLSEESARMIVDMLIEQMHALGAFDPPPPAPPAAPAPAAAAASTDTVPAETGPPAAETAPPRKTTFAERFAGV
jgi:hypothetical protein